MSIGGDVLEFEQLLFESVGAEKLKIIGEQIVEIVREHELHKSPDVCQMLFRYLSSVIEGWNCV